MNQVIFNGFSIDDSGLKVGELSLFETRSLVGTELQPDELDFTAYGDKTAQGFLVTEGQLEVLEGDFFVEDPGSYNLLCPYGTPVQLYRNGALVGNFFVRESAQTAPNEYRFACFSEIGLLVYLKYYGGVYAGTPAGDILADILQGFTYTVDAEVASAPLYGHIPICDRRTALQTVCFALGANVFRTASGIVIKYNKNYTVEDIAQSSVYIDGRSFAQKVYATTVNVTEYGYYDLPTDPSVLLFDNTGSSIAASTIVEFDKPCHDLVAVGLTIEESGANYAIVSGTGTLTGQEYTVTKQVISKTTNSTAMESREINSSDCHLVSAANSLNVVARLSAFYSKEREINEAFVMGAEVCGYPYNVPDIEGNAKTGFLAECISVFSSIRKGSGKFVTDWTPSNFGNNFSNYVILTGSGTWTLPQGAGAIRVVIGAAGDGGDGGHGGETSGVMPFGDSWTKTAANKGGAGGAAGAGGKVLIIDIDTPAASYAYACGTAGAGGSGGTADDATPPTSGGAGGASTFGAYTSDDGAAMPTGYVNALTGDVYSADGEAGYAGGNGQALNDNGRSPTIGGSVSTWSGGAVGLSLEHTGDIGTQFGAGGSGGGAAYGANGGNGGDASYNSSIGFYYGGAGGSGANAVAPANQTVYGAGANGGNGGGGGGYPGLQYNLDDYGSNPNAGAGGSGSAGASGGEGYILIYY